MFKKDILGTSYRDQEIIIKQGTTGDSLYVIQEGKVEVIEEEREEILTGMVVVVAAETVTTEAEEKEEEVIRKTRTGSRSVFQFR